MKAKHVQIRIKQCLALAEASGCPRRKLGAMLLDPERNVILADGYNGGPRGGFGSLCKGHWCERNGLERAMFKVSYCSDTYVKALDRTFGNPGWYIHADFPVAGITEVSGTWKTVEEAWRVVDALVEKNPPVKSGTKMERGCHHAEMNVICNAAANGIKCKGALMICLAEPCMMCAKLIHHSGITKLVVVDGGYLGGKEGLDYLRLHHVEVEEVEGPKDPRLEW